MLSVNCQGAHHLLLGLWIPSAIFLKNLIPEAFSLIHRELLAERDWVHPGYLQQEEPARWRHAPKASPLPLENQTTALSDSVIPVDR